MHSNTFCQYTANVYLGVVAIRASSPNIEALSTSRMDPHTLGKGTLVPRIAGITVQG